jgi:hypothetical protein
MPTSGFERERADDLFQQRRLRTVPIRFSANGVPFNSVVGQFTADQTMQFRGASISAIAMGAPDQYVFSVSVSNSASTVQLGFSGNTESVWIEQIGTSGHGTNPAVVQFGSDYDGFYLNVGETLYIIGTNALPALGPGVAGPGWLLGTVLLYFLPTFRQTGGQ